MKAEETTEAPVEIAVQKVFLAIGFSRPTSGLADAFGLRTDERGYVVTKPNGIGAPSALPRASLSAVICVWVPHWWLRRFMTESAVLKRSMRF